MINVIHLGLTLGNQESIFEAPITFAETGYGIIGIDNLTNLEEHKEELHRLLDKTIEEMQAVLNEEATK